MGFLKGFMKFPTFSAIDARVYTYRFYKIPQHLTFEKGEKKKEEGKEFYSYSGYILRGVTI